jgi:aminoglycoside phosphotransferase (APT) family kinase protein
MTSPPAAAGVRLPWEGVPARVRSAIEEVCGSAVTEARTQPAGFSPGVAVRVLCEDRTRHFVKAVSAEANSRSPDIHRREAQVLAALEPVIAARRLPVPRLRGVVDQHPWVALVLDDVDGRHPAQPWDPAELGQVVAALTRLAEVLTPAPIPLPAVGDLHGRAFTGWRKLARSAEAERLDGWWRARLGDLTALEATWAAHAAGDTLLHSDVRADNVLLTADGVVIVDWPNACRGAAFVDHVLLAPSVAMQGGPQPPDLLAMSPAGRGADPQSLAATVCAVTGYFTYQAPRRAAPIIDPEAKAS